MRATVFFCVFLALAAFLLAAVSAQPPRREAIIILFNDSACTQHIRTERVFQPNTTKCEAEPERERNMSSVFECDTDMNNVTHLIENVYNNTLACDNTAVFSLTSTAPAHSCAQITAVFEGDKRALYGHVECAPPNATSAAKAGVNLLSATKAVGPMKVAPKSWIQRLFNL